MLILVGCNQHSKDVGNVKDVSKNIENHKESKTSQFPIDEVINKSEKRKSKYNIEDKACGECKSIPSDFFKKYLANHTVKNIKDFTLKFDQYSRYYFFDYVVHSDFVLFTIIHDDEDGYDNYYHFTYDQINNKITDVVLVASVGGDGGHYQHETLIFTNSFKDLLVKTKSYYDEDLFDELNKDCYSHTVDAFDTKFSFDRSNTKLNQLNMKTTFDTICK